MPVGVVSAMAGFTVGILVAVVLVVSMRLRHFFGHRGSHECTDNPCQGEHDDDQRHHRPDPYGMIGHGRMRGGVGRLSRSMRRR